MKCKKCCLEMIEEKPSLFFTLKKSLKYIGVILLLWLLLGLTDLKIVETIIVIFMAVFGVWCVILFLSHLAGAVKRYRCPNCERMVQRVSFLDLIVDLLSSL